MHYLIRLSLALSESFWFLPAVMMLMAVGAALGSTALDHQLGGAWVQNIGWVWSGGANGARSVLSTVAGSMMTVVSIVFSLTLTTLAQTSSHFGPRVLRNFVTDRGNQFVLGTFVATFLYCLMVLRTIRSVEEQTFVPYLSVNLGLAMTVGSLAVLIYFIHHLSQSIQAEQLLAGIGKDFEQILPRIFPVSQQEPDQAEPWLKAERWQASWVIAAKSDGYLQHIDQESLLKLASEHQLILKLERRPGDFISQGMPLLYGLPGNEPDTSLIDSIRACFVQGRQRTPQQDAAYYLHQLVEIAQRAMSPGINEPYTALSSIDWLGACLRRVAAYPQPSPLRRDDKGNLCLMVPVLGFNELVKTTLTPLRLVAVSNPDVVVHTLKMLTNLAPALERETDRQALFEQAQLLGKMAQEELSFNPDCARVQEALDQALSALRSLH